MKNYSTSFRTIIKETIMQVVQFHPNSNYISTGSNDRSVRVWDVHTGNCVRVFTGHKVNDLFYSKYL